MHGVEPRDKIQLRTWRELDCGRDRAG